jgi:hypothetical protein
MTKDAKKDIKRTGPVIAKKSPTKFFQEFIKWL